MNQTAFNLNKPYIQSYTDDSLTIDNTEFSFPVILSPTKIMINNLPDKFEDFYPKIIPKLISMKPELILIGTGTKHQIMDGQVNQSAIGIDVMTTGAACRIYNVMIEESRNVLAALY